MWDLGPILVVDDEATALVNLEAESFVVQAMEICAAADGDEDDVGVNLAWADTSASKFSYH